MHRSIAVKLVSVSALCIVCAFSSVGICQDKLERALTEGGIFETKEQFRLLIKDLRELRDPVINNLLPVVEDVALGRKVRDSFVKKHPSLRLLNSKAVRGELEMVDSQLEEMKTVSQELPNSVAEKIRDLKFRSLEETATQLREIHSFSTAELESVFLPHQQERFRQVQIQLQLKRQDVIGILTSEPVASELKVTDEQIDKIRESAKEINQELAKKIEELRAQARNKLLSNLDQAQRDKLDDLIGEPIAISKKLRNDKASEKENKKNKKEKLEKPKKRKIKN